jgi:3-oxoacyl-[acyl-carrier-protein] synthase-3
VDPHRRDRVVTDVVITGWGGALPPTTVTNEVFERRLDTTDAWIVERTGIRERRSGGIVGDLSVEAGQAALDRAGVDPSSVDLLVLATMTPDQTMPATSARVHGELGLGGGAFDLNAACSGFVYTLFTGYSVLLSGAVSRVLLIGSDVMTTVVDPDDRSTAVLFGDGAGALLLESQPTGRVDPGANRFLGWDFGVDATARTLLQADLGGTITMEGREVYRRAVRATVDSACAALDRAGCTPADIDLFVPHQANRRIIEAVAERIGIPMERTAVTVDRTGNTSAASIPLALAEAADAGRVGDGDTILVAGFGAGMTWASAVFRWGTGTLTDGSPRRVGPAGPPHSAGEDRTGRPRHPDRAGPTDAATPTTEEPS